MRELYCGDNLEILRTHVPDRAVDLIYLDPPFNSNRAYNLLFQSPAGDAAGSQITAFEDTWHWSGQTETVFGQLLNQPNSEVAGLMTALRSVLHENGMMAYLVMMAIRLIELHRVLKTTGSLYLHCDSKASHYLKILLDSIFGHANFRNEIIWHYYNKYSAGKRLFPRSFDQILFYSASGSYTFNPQRELRDKPAKQLLRVNVGGVLKNKKDAAGKTMTRIVHDRKVDAVWRIPCLQPASREMLGFPTQKPLALLERIIRASSNPGDVVLDPFCGCGSAVHAAENLGRSWIGIDATHLALDFVEHRMNEAYPGLRIDINGIPGDLEDARNLARQKPHAAQS